MINAIHVTHEAVHKVGGIGTVLEGLINSRPYRDGVGRTVLVCPLFYPEDSARLGPTGDIEYSSLDQIHTGPHVESFRHIEREFGVHLVYGQRLLVDEASARQMRCEVLLVDLRGINHDPVNALKGRLWEHYGLRSDQYEHQWEYEQYVELAPAAIAALEVLELAAPDAPAVVFAHEFMGVPLALASQCTHPHHYRTLFYAHEVAPVRRIIERHAGHDVMFYNALAAAQRDGLYLEEVFGPQHDYHKHAVVEAARFCDGLLAVGPHVRDELQFMGPEFDGADIGLAYNGVPFGEITLKQRQTSRERIRDYCENLLGRRPDLIFTHVTRLAPSKAMWRDIDVLAAMDNQLGQRNQTAVMLVLATELPRRPEEEILRMEREWNWPLTHRVGEPDLTGGEALFYEHVQAFNARAENITVIFINQFGFDRRRCGLRVPADVEFLDIRRATDVEFGLSLYEPFGISPLEPLAYGGICLVSTSCGCSGALKHATRGRRSDNIVFANYIDLIRRPRTLDDSLAIGDEERRYVERKLAEQLAEQVLQRLPASNTEAEELIRSGYELARKMSWDVVAERYVFPSILRACARRRILSVA